MTRVLYWNIENFGVNKIQGVARTASGKKIFGSFSAESADRWAYIYRHIEELNPDIFVVVEVETPWRDNRGTLCAGAGAQGLEVMLKNLRGVNPGWSLVPALITGKTESVGVFFREDQLIFTGPDVWTGGNGPVVTGQAPADYPDDWDVMTARTIPDAAGYNSRRDQSQCAARVQFLIDDHTTLDFGAGIRAPYQTTFWDPTNQRNINIFSVHAPACYEGATQFIENLALLPAIVGDPPADEVRLVLGDFNLNLLRVPTTASVHGPNTYTGCYDPLTRHNFRVALLPDLGNANLPPALSDGYRGYYATHIRGTGAAEFYSTVTSTRYYPGYAYISASNDSIDNVLYRGRAIQPQVTVINGVVGSPYSNAGANPQVQGTGGLVNSAPEGFQAFGSELVWSWNQAPVVGGPPNTAPWIKYCFGMMNSITGWHKYGKIRSTSDHLPLFFTF